MEAFAPRERQVIELVRSGLPYKQVASHLEISLHTVDVYIRRISEKIPGNLPPRTKIMMLHPQE